MLKVLLACVSTVIMVKSVRPAARLEGSPPKSDTDDDLTFLSWDAIRRLGGPSKWTLLRAAQRGEITLTKIGRSGGALASEYRRYVEARKG